VALATLCFAAALLAKGELNVWAVTAGAAVLSLAAAFAADRRRLAALLVPRRRDAVLGLAAGAALVLATHLLYGLAARLLPDLQAVVRQLYAELEAPPGPLAALPITAVVVLAEEVVWRGLLVDELLARLGTAPQRRTALLAAATLLYAVPHLVAGIPVLLLAALALGAVWTTLRLATGGLGAPLLSHLVWSAAVFALWPLG
jgi:hypothetical protein